MLTPLLNQGEAYQDLPYASSLCGACYEACPVKIPLHDMLVALRRRNVEQRRTKWAERMAFQGYRMVFAKAGRYKRVIRWARTVQKPLLRQGYIESTMGPLMGWTESRQAPAPVKQSFREWFQSIQQEWKRKDNGGDRS